MKSIADIYSDLILRAVLGRHAHAAKVDDPERLRRIAEHLADSEAAQAALQAKGYGRDAGSFLQLAAEVPNYAPNVLKRMFAPRTPVCYPNPAAAGDARIAR